MKRSRDGFAAQIGRISMEWVQVMVASVINRQGARCSSGDSRSVFISLIWQGESFCYLLHCAVCSVFYVICNWHIWIF